MGRPTSRATAKWSRTGCSTRAGRSSSGWSLHTRRLIRYTPSAHVNVVGQAGSGKSAGIFTVNKLLGEGSDVNVDPTGKLSRIVRRALQRRGCSNWEFKPFNTHGEDPGVLKTYSIFQTLDPNRESVAEMAMSNAAAMVIREVGPYSFFGDNAASNVTATQLYLCTLPESMRTFDNLINISFMPLDAYKTKVLKAMVESNRYNRVLSRLGNQFDSMQQTMLASVLSTVQRSLNSFMASPEIMRQMKADPSVDWSSLKSIPTSAIITLPPDKLSTQSRWLRVLLTQVIHGLMTHEKPARPVNLWLDECASLTGDSAGGEFDILMTALQIGRNYSIRCILGYQDYSQIRYAWDKRWESVLANCSCTAFLGTSDAEFTAQLISRMCGNSTQSILSENYQPGRPDGGGQIGVSGRPLLTPDEVMQLPRDQQILFIENQPPILCRKLRYYADPEFKHLADSPLY